MKKIDLAVFVIIEDIPQQEDKIVLVCDGKKFPQKWKLPGGKNNTGLVNLFGSGYEATLYREVFEEIGVNVYDLEIIYKNDDYGHLLIFCKAKYYSGDICQKDTKGIMFRKRKQVRCMIRSNLILPNHARILAEYLNSRPY